MTKSLFWAVLMALLALSALFDRSLYAQASMNHYADTSKVNVVYFLGDGTSMNTAAYGGGGGEGGDTTYHVPSPYPGDSTKYLRGNRTWGQTIPYQVASEKIGRDSLGVMVSSSIGSNSTSATFYGYTLLETDTMATDYVDWNKGDYQFITIGANKSIAWANLPSATSARARSIMVEVTSTGSFTVSWPGDITWKGGSAPTQSVSKTDLYSFVRRGAKIYGSVSQNY